MRCQVETRQSGGHAATSESDEGTGRNDQTVRPLTEDEPGLLSLLLPLAHLLNHINSGLQRPIRCRRVEHHVERVPIRAEPLETGDEFIREEEAFGRELKKVAERLDRGRVCGLGKSGERGESVDSLEEELECRRSAMNRGLAFAREGSAFGGYGVDSKDKADPGDKCQHLCLGFKSGLANAARG